MIDYCGGCFERKTVKPCHLPDMGGLEDYFCAPCRKELKKVTPVEILKER